MEAARAVPLWPTIYFLDRGADGDVWISLDTDELKERLTNIDIDRLYRIGDVIRETGWTPEVEINGVRYLVAWGSLEPYPENVDQSP